MTRFRWVSPALLVWVAGPIVPISMAVAGLIVARNLHPSLYGHVAYFFSSFNLITVLLQLGLGPQTTREVAWSLGKGGISAVSRVIPPYFIARIVSVAVLLPVGIVAVALGDFAMAGAAAAGGISLLRDFAQALAVGLGRGSLVAGHQLGQGLLYLAVIILWARDEPAHVIAAVIVTSALALVLGLWACRRALPRGNLWWSLSRGRWAAVSRSLGWLYAIALLQTPFSSLAVLSLGRAGRFEDAAAFSIGLTLPLVLSVSSATIIAVHYYPRLCHLLGESNSETLEHFSSVYRVLAWVCLSASAILFVHAKAVTAVLFTAAYGSAVEPLTSLALAAAVIPIGQFALWTLIAHDQKGLAITGAVAQLFVVVASVAATLIVPGLPLWMLGTGHLFAAATALSLWVVGLRRAGTRYDWQPVRVAAAALAAFVAAALMRLLTPDGQLASLLLLGGSGVVVLVAVGLVLLGGADGSKLWPIRHALTGRMSRS